MQASFPLYIWQFLGSERSHCKPVVALVVLRLGEASSKSYNNVAYTLLYEQHAREKVDMLFMEKDVLPEC